MSAEKGCGTLSRAQITGGGTTPAVAKRLLLASVAAVLALGAMAPPGAARQPVSMGPSVLDGPSSAILTPAGLGLSIARDGTGGLVYLKRVDGTAHVFVSRLVNGSFRPPVQVDGALPATSSQPVIAAANGGLLLVAFINDGDLWVVDGGHSFGSPQLLADGASNPAISISSFGKGYLAFALQDGQGYDVRTAYYDSGSWSLETPPLNVTSADDAGTGVGRPAVAAAGDGIALVVWGEQGQDGLEHVYSRQVWGTQASPAVEQADAPSGGWPPAGCVENWAGNPAVSVGGDSSYAPVAFQEQVTCGGQPQSRVLMNRFHAGQYDGIIQADGLSDTSDDGADDPQIAVSEYGHGWVTSARTDSDDLFAAWLSAYGWFQGPASQVNSLATSAPPDQVPAIAGLSASLIAWQQEPGSAGGGEIRIRYAPEPNALGPETTISSAAQGPTDAGEGLAAGGDDAGDAAIAWLQGSAGAIQLIVDQLYAPPGAFSPTKSLVYSNSAHPVLRWPRPAGWGPMTYSILVHGRRVDRTISTSVRLSSRLSNGPHHWQVVATNPVGEQTRTRPATVFVDTVAPRAAIRVGGQRSVGSPLGVQVSYADLPPAGKPRSDASGVAKVEVRWGDGAVSRLSLGKHLAAHVYRRPGRYRIVLVVADRAGNVSRVVKFVELGGAGG